MQTPMKIKWLLWLPLCFALGFSGYGIYQLVTRQVALDALEALQETRQASTPIMASPIQAQPIQAPPNEALEVAKPRLKINPISDFHMKLIQKNKDYMGWIEIANTPVAYPVVRADDNDYYLKRDFNLRKTDLGSIFMDYRNLGNMNDSHTIIYGHYVKNGSMFGSLKGYLDRSYWAKHPIIQMDSPYGIKRYRVFAVQEVSAENYTLSLAVSRDYIRQLAGESRFPEASEKVLLGLGLDIGKTPEKPLAQGLLTLATCTYTIEEGRLLVHALEILE